MRCCKDVGVKSSKPRLSLNPSQNSTKPLLLGRLFLPKSPFWCHYMYCNYCAGRIRSIAANLASVIGGSTCSLRLDPILHCKLALWTGIKVHTYKVSDASFLLCPSSLTYTDTAIATKAVFQGKQRNSIRGSVLLWGICKKLLRRFRRYRTYIFEAAQCH